MKIINVKKLIASTLIFLFASITTPALGDEPVTYIPMRSKIEHVVMHEMPEASLGVLQIAKFNKNTHYFSENVQAEIDYKSFLSLPITFYDPAALLFEDDAYEISSVGYAWHGKSLDDTQKTLLSDPDFVVDLQQTGSKIITTPDSESQLLLMSGWDFRGSLPSAYFLSVLFVGAYLCFRGCRVKNKKQKTLAIHTKGWPVTMPHVSRIIQLLAQHLAKIDTLIVPAKEKALWLYAQKLLQRAKGRSITDLLRTLSQ